MNMISKILDPVIAPKAMVTFNNHILDRANEYLQHIHLES